MGPTLGTLIMSSLMVTASGMVKDGVVPWRDLKRGCPASPLKNAFHASAWSLSTYRVMLVCAKPRDFVAQAGELLAEREERNRRRFLPVGLRLLMGVIVLHQYGVPDEAAGACLSGQAPCVGPGAWQKPVDDVAVCGGLAHAVGPSAQGSFGDGKISTFPSRDHDTICPNCQGIIQGKEQAFPIPATGEIGRNLVRNRTVNPSI